MLPNIAATNDFGRPNNWTCLLQVLCEGVSTRFGIWATNPRKVSLSHSKRHAQPAVSFSKIFVWGALWRAKSRTFTALWRTKKSHFRASGKTRMKTQIRTIDNNKSEDFGNFNAPRQNPMVPFGCFPTQILAFVVIEFSYLRFHATGRPRAESHCGEQKSRTFTPRMKCV